MIPSDTRILSEYIRICEVYIMYSIRVNAYVFNIIAHHFSPLHQNRSGTRIPPYARERMLLYNKGKTFSDILRELQLAGCPVSIGSRYQFSSKDQKATKKRLELLNNATKRLLTMEYYEYIDNEMAKNDELCAGGKKVSLIYRIVFNINPIEMVWYEMKHYLRKYAKPKTKAELEEGIYDF